MTDDIITQADRQAKANHEELIRLRIVNATLHDEIERLRTLIRDASEVLTAYGDGGVVYPDEEAVLTALRVEALRVR